VANVKLNHEYKVQKMLSLVKSWSKRDCQSLEKFISQKTFILSQFVYIMQSIGLLDVILQKKSIKLFSDSKGK